MPMAHDEFEKILNELYGDVTADRKTELLGILRTEQSTNMKDIESHSKKIEELETDNKGLQIANGQLFRQIGFESGASPEEKEQEKQKSFSESITIEALEGN